MSTPPNTEHGSGSRLSQEAVGLKVGEELEIVLPGRASAGYRWREEVDAGSDVASVRWRRGLDQAPKTLPPGHDVPEIAIIRAEKAGTVRIRFIHVRPWEPKPRPAAERIVTVKVRE